MNYISVCSGIEAATQAWHPLGWKPLAFSEIEPFPSAVLAHHYPSVPNLGDMTKYHDWPEYRPDLIVGGTPCQAFSVAGLRQGLSDPRGNLTLTFLGLVDRYRPRWVVWENVPGVLSDRTNAFGQFLAGLGQLGYGWAYRVLDAQYFGVAQRRKRVFVVGCLGDWTCAAAVLFEPESLRGNPPPSRKTRQAVAPTLAARTRGGGGLGTDFDCDGGCIPIQEPGKRTGRSTTDRGVGGGIGESGDPCYTLQAGAVHGVAYALRAEGFDASEDGTGRGTPIVEWPVQVAPTLNASFGSKQGLEDQHALGEGGCSSLAKCLTAKSQRNDAETETLIPTLQGGFFDDPIAFNANAQAQQLPRADTDTTINHGLTCSQNAAVAIGFQDDTTPKFSEERIGAQRADAGGQGPCVAFQSSQSGVRVQDVHATLDANNGSRRHNGVLSGLAVRRLTPTECERLQGFPDGFTNIPWRLHKEAQKKGVSYESLLLSKGIKLREPAGEECPDGPRYKALGNSMAVPCMSWIGKRIAAVSAIETEDLDEAD